MAAGNFALLCDISHHLNYLYTKIQGPQSSFDIFGPVKRLSDHAETIFETV
jgi:hypothetical protein